MINDKKIKKLISSVQKEISSKERAINKTISTEIKRVTSFLNKKKLQEMIKDSFGGEIKKISNFLEVQKKEIQNLQKTLKKLSDKKSPSPKKTSQKKTAKKKVTKKQTSKKAKTTSSVS